jgi:C-terminal processing protease CtpA/Prc
MLVTSGGHSFSVVAILTLSACHASRPSTSSDQCVGAAAYSRDADAALRSIRESYVYVNEKAVDWNRAESLTRTAVNTVHSKRDLLGVLERLLDNLYDAHAIVRANTSHSPRIVPSGVDLWAEWIDGDAIVTAVRSGYGAERQGVRPGMHVLAINGVPIKDAVDSRLGPAVNYPSPAEARAWALVSALAGRHDRPRVLRVRDSGGTKDISLDSVTPFLIDRAMNEPPVEARTINAPAGSAYGYIRLNALDDLRSVPAFDSALEMLRGAPGLILDLRNNPAGGNTSVAEPILGRFIRQRQGYQRVAPRHGRAYTRMTEPRGPWTYTRRSSCSSAAGLEAWVKGWRSAWMECIAALSWGRRWRDWPALSMT